MTNLRQAMGTALAIVCLAVPATAEPIQITAGSLGWGPAGGVSIGLAGGSFVFIGAASVSGGIFTPWILCNGGLGCQPGTAVDLRSLWSGSDLPGTAVYQGVTYPLVGGSNSPNQLVAEWTGALDIPAGFTGGLLTAPFGFSGTFRYAPNLMQTPQVLDLTGSGVASVTFAEYPADPGSFFLTSVRYDFGESAGAVPEPMSMILVGTGLAGLAVLRRQRRSKEART
jgi:PEP-CTERM motif-containing protein